jgi:hypothetical protein
VTTHAWHDFDSLDLVERIMELQEEFSIEIPAEISDEDCRRWLDTGELPGDWLNGAPVPRRGLPPTLPGGAQSPIPSDDVSDDEE